MLSFFNKRRSFGTVGVYLGSDVVSIAKVSDEGKQSQLSIPFFVSQACDSLKERLELTKKLFAEHKLSKQKLSFILSPTDYELHLIDALDVEAAELGDAAKWKIKDLLAFNVQEAVVDAFEVYEEPPPGRPNQVYAVAAKIERLQPWVDLAESYGCQIESIGIQEMACRNLVEFSYQTDDSVALLLIGNEHSELMIFQQSRFFLSREIEQGINALAHAADEALWEEFALDIQRSFDYYESKFVQRAVTKIILSPTADQIPGCVKNIQDRLDLDIDVFDLSTHFVLPSDAESPNHFGVLAACGGAMQKPVVS